MFWKPLENPPLVVSRPSSKCPPKQFKAHDDGCTHDDE
jgi:hypothetical protein